MLDKIVSSTQAAFLANAIRAPDAKNLAILPLMEKKSRNPYRVEVGERLRITAADLGFASAQELAVHLGLNRGQVDAWYNGRAMPPVQHMVPFCTQWGLTLEWIYRGEPAGLSSSRNIRLSAAMKGMEVPRARNAVEAADEPPAEFLRNQDRARVRPRKPVRRKPKAIVT